VRDMRARSTATRFMNRDPTVREPGRTRALALVRTAALLALTALVACVAWWVDHPTLLALALVVAAEESLEMGVVIAALRGTMGRTTAAR
jgi:hypothetical protein